MAAEQATPRFDVAVIGMSGQFPGARDLKEFWNNLAGGVESVRRFTDEELLQRGVDPACLQDSDFVKASPVLEAPDHFAAAFFGYSPREAELMDPQQRLFLEHSWAALEDAGYPPRHLREQVGVFAGMSLSSYLLFNLSNNPALDQKEEAFQAMIGGDKDFLCTRLAYKLNLKGPSLTVQTGCSTSLVAAHIAVQHLLTYQCDLAITGGVSVGVPQRTGYYYQPGGIASPDGHCRPFDAQAQGTLFGEGIGVVILKRLEDALRDRDHIYAVMRGSAINNDGSGKIGFTAPGAEGQRDVISRALSIADVPPESISYIETHGTATALGDLVEVSALAEVFQSQASMKNSCALGSVKSNIGHLDAAAGIAGLIKTALMLKNRRLAPILHFKQANPKIDFSKTPFYVNTENLSWTSKNGPLRAGVSSFGIGGTNAHVILEEAPAVLKSRSERALQVICFSAETEGALAAATENLSHYAEGNCETSAADVAFTLHLGREQFQYRRVLVAPDLRTVGQLLRELSPDQVFTNHAEAQPRPITAMFPGGGSQYAGMGAELYSNEPVFRQEIDRCAELLKKIAGFSLQKVVYPAEREFELSTQRLLRPSAGLPAIFATEYALAKLFLSWGVKPTCMIGHSLGEYTAACLAGVFSLEDALRLVAFRGRMFESLPSGAMLSVTMPESELEPLPEGISIAAINTPDQCVLSGPAALIDKMASDLKAREIEHHRVHIEAAAHCSMVEPVMQQFRDFLRQIPLSAPAIPFVSNLTGTWITESQATQVDYWVQHLRQTVRFADGLKCITNDGRWLMLEMGPGRTLSTFARQQLREKGKAVFAPMRHPQDTASELLTTYNCLARMWSTGIDVDWPGFYRYEECRRVSLPTYPFERERYWIGPPVAESSRKPVGASGSRSKKARLYAPSWRRTESISSELPSDASLWIILADTNGVAASLSQTLQRSGQKVIAVTEKSAFKVDGAVRYTLGSCCEASFEKFFQALRIPSNCKINVVHLWTLHADREAASSLEFYEAQEHGLYSLVYLVRALGKSVSPAQCCILVVSSRVAQVSGGDPVQPEKAGLAAACTVLQQEYGNLTCALMDVAPLDFSGPGISRISNQILAEATSSSGSLIVAYRGWHRWVLDYEQITAQPKVGPHPAESDAPIYLITGGLGSLGPVLAHHLARKGPCKIAFTTRADFPPQNRWHELLASNSTDKRLRETVACLADLKQKGIEVIVCRADVANLEEMNHLLDRVENTLGKITGVIHLAGITGDKALRLVTDLEVDDYHTQFRPKAEGCYVLRNVLRSRAVAFCVLFSSTASLLAGPGMLAYGAGSCFLDAFAANRSLEGLPWISINWDGWINADSAHFVGDRATSLDRYALRYPEALAAFDEILAIGRYGQIIVSSSDVSARIEDWLQPRGDSAPARNADSHLRPALSVEYAAPRTSLQKTITTIWSEVLGMEQVGIHDNLFELGGSSLIGLRIVARLKKELNIEVPVTALFEGPTISTLSQLIEAKKAPAAQETYTDSRNRGMLRRNARQRVEATT